MVSVGRAEAVLLRELPLFACIDLRLDVRNQAAKQAAEQTLGAALPGPNSWVAAADAQILWQAYDEWLVMGRDGSQGMRVSSLRKALAGTHCAITDVSDLRTAFGLHGPRAREVLQKGCAVDLHPRAFGLEACVQTALARLRVTLRRIDGEANYEVLVERSFAAYLWSWMTDAVTEYL